MQDITVSTRSIQPWVKYDYNPRSDQKSDPGLYSHLTQLDRKSADGDFLQLGSSRAGNSSEQILEKAPTSFEARMTNFQHFGAKAHANILKGAFSTDCTSNSTRIGQMAILNPYPKSYFKDIIIKTRKCRKKLEKTKTQIVGNANCCFYPRHRWGKTASELLSWFFQCNNSQHLREKWHPQLNTPVVIIDDLQQTVPEGILGNIAAGGSIIYEVLDSCSFSFSRCVWCYYFVCHLTICSV